MPEAYIPLLGVRSLDAQDLYWKASNWGHLSLTSQKESLKSQAFWNGSGGQGEAHVANNLNGSFQVMHF